MSCALSIQDLTCQYDNQTVLESLSLEVQHGEIVCLLGASGCGKTTLLKAIAGLLPLSSGNMSLNCLTIDDGENWVPPESRNIGMIFQDYALFPHLTVAQNVAFGLKGKSEGDKQNIVDEMLALVHLSELGERYPHQLSGGQQQRVAIARSLAYKPDLLLLDEPFSNIDTQVRHALIGEIRKIFKSQGVTAIFVTHSREEAFAFSDKLAVMNNGVIEQFGSASELYGEPSSKFVADFLGGGGYLPATVVGDHFHTQLGSFNIKQGHQLNPQARYSLLLRPQSVRLSKVIESEFQVADVHFLGDDYRYVVEGKGEKLLATSMEYLDVGQTVSIEVLDTSPIFFET
jgi:iron(III) transport system ATP-binding protein